MHCKPSCKFLELSEQKTAALNKPHTVIDMQVSADGTYITTTDGLTVRFWDAASLNPIKEVGLSFGVECASLNGEDKYVARICLCANMKTPQAMSWIATRSIMG